MSRRYSEPFKFSIEESISFAYETLRRANVAGALIGTVRTWFELPASSQYQTKDINIAIRQEDAPWIERAIREVGIEPGYSEIGGVCVEIPGKGVKVDFIDRRIALSGLFREAIKQAQDNQEFVEFGDVKIHAVPLEYLIAMKLVPAREKDDLILDALLREAHFDYVKAREIVERFLGVASANRLDALARRAGRTFSPKTS